MVENENVLLPLLSKSLRFFSLSIFPEFFILFFVLSFVWLLDTLNRLSSSVNSTELLSRCIKVEHCVLCTCICVSVYLCTWYTGTQTQSASQHGKSAEKCESAPFSHTIGGITNVLNVSPCTTHTSLQMKHSYTRSGVIQHTGLHAVHTRLKQRGTVLLQDP